MSLEIPAKGQHVKNGPETSAVLQNKCLVNTHCHCRTPPRRVLSARSFRTPNPRSNNYLILILKEKNIFMVAYNAIGTVTRLNS